MSRLVPSRPIHARLRRHLGTLPHGLPTALTFTVAVGGLLAGTTILAGAVLQAAPRHEPNRLEAADDPAAAGPHLATALDTTTPHAGSSTAGEVGPVPATYQQPAQRSAGGGLRTAFVADGHPSWGDPGVVGAGRRDGSDDDDRRVEGDHGWQGDHHQPGQTPTPEPDHHWSGPSPTPTPEPDHHWSGPSPTPTPEPDHHRPTPTPTPTPEPDHHRPTPTPEPDHHRPTPTPTPTPEP